ncbi:Magnetosome protein MamE [Candidatus Magnetomoraceae bacterium gMMP-15]
MKKDSLCPQNFQVWVAFLMGMVVIVIAIVAFDNIMGKSRVGETVENTGGEVSVNIGQQVSLLKDNDSSAWLGIEANDVTENMAEQLDLKVSKGVLASRVIENSPADNAGILSGDILYEFDRRTLKDTEHLSELLSKAEPGDRVRIGLFRDNSRKVYYVVLGEAQSQNSQALQLTSGDDDTLPEDWQLGIVVSELTAALRQMYNIPEDENGVIVMLVVPESSADSAGLQKGDLIQQMNKSRIDQMIDFFETVEDAENDNILFNIYRNGYEMYVNLVAVSSNTDQTVAVAQEGIGMNRPLYVPGYDQTQSGEPEEKTTSNLYLDKFGI